MPNRSDSGPPPTAPRPVVLLYDRHITPARDVLLARLAACQRYALARGWVPVGTWIDAGACAFTAEVRPELDAALSHVPRLRRDEHGRTRDVVLLVHDPSRLSNDAFAVHGLVWTIEFTGARFEAVSGR